MFLNEPHGHVVAPPLFNNRAEGKVMANEHSVGGAILDTCLWYMSIPGEPMALKPYAPSVRCDKNVPESY